MSNLDRRLPSLHALKAFEAAARLGAFNRAADELGLSPTAVSHHIRGLEAELGTELFVRSTRRISLTDDGKLLADICSRSFGSLGDAVEILRRGENRRSVAIALGPLLASRWLTPRLNRFWETFPEIDLRILHTSLRVDPKAIAADIYLAWGEGWWPDLQARPFLALSGMPVASPDYLKRHDRPKIAEDLLEHFLIHQRSRTGWQQWLAPHGIELPMNSGGTTIEDANVVVRTALSGQGIALGWLPLIENEVASGELVPLFEAQPAAPLGYHLVKSPDADTNANVRKIMQWLSDEAASPLVVKKG